MNLTEICFVYIEQNNIEHKTGGIEANLRLSLCSFILRISNVDKSNPCLSGNLGIQALENLIGSLVPRINCIDLPRVMLEELLNHAVHELQVQRYS